MKAIQKVLVGLGIGGGLVGVIYLATRKKSAAGRATLRGSLIGDDGWPVYDVTVTIQGKSITAGMIYNVADLELIACTATFSKEGYVTKTVNFPASGSGALVSGDNIRNIVMSPGSGKVASLFGRVNINGTFTKIQGVTVTCQGKTATTGINGDYSIEGLDASPADVIFTAEGYETLTLPEYDLLEGSNEVNVGLEPTTAEVAVLKGKISIMGTFTGILGAVVSCQGKTATTDVNGNFRLEALEARQGMVTINATDYKTASFPDYVLAAGENELNTGLEPTGASAVGNVNINGTFTNIPNVIVSCQGKTTITDINGNYTLSGLTVGAAQIVFTADGYETLAMNITLLAGANTINVGLVPVGPGPGPGPNPCTELLNTMNYIVSLYLSGTITYEVYLELYIPVMNQYNAQCG